MNSTYTVTTVVFSFLFSALFMSHFHEYLFLTLSLLLLELLPKTSASKRQLSTRCGGVHTLLSTFALPTPYAYSVTNKCTSIRVLPSSDTVLHQAVSQKQLYKKRHYECLMLSARNRNSNKWKDWKLSCIGKSAGQQQEKLKLRFIGWGIQGKKKKYSSLGMAESLWNVCLWKRWGKMTQQSGSIFIKMWHVSA